MEVQRLLIFLRRLRRLLVCPLCLSLASFYKLAHVATVTTGSFLDQVVVVQFCKGSNCCFISTRRRHRATIHTHHDTSLLTHRHQRLCTRSVAPTPATSARLHRCLCFQIPREITQRAAGRRRSLRYSPALPVKPLPSEEV